jgi:TM2 domain-containing membrane protein YozV
MKTKISTLFIVVTLLLSSCAKESFYFTNTGTSYGSKKVKSETTATTTTEQAATAADEAFAVETTAPENLTASTEKTAAITKKDFTKAKPLYLAKVTTSTQTEKISKVAQAKAAIKVNKQIKAIVKEAKKNDISGATAEGEGKSQIIAAVLAFVVGVLGIHRFYLGYTGIGIAQLLTLGGCGIWALIDLIRIIIGDLKPKDGSDYTTKF